MTVNLDSFSQVQLQITTEGYLILIPAAHYAAMEKFALALPESLLITRLFQFGIMDVIYQERTSALVVVLRPRDHSDPQPITEQIRLAAQIKHTIDAYINDALAFADL